MTCTLVQFCADESGFLAGRIPDLRVNSKSKQETFMKMISAGAGLGVGVKDYRVIFVFENDKALTQFLDSGWSGSAQTDAAAKAGKSSAALLRSGRGCPRSVG
jgi:lipid-binding SYLF domain-containing protein